MKKLCILLCLLLPMLLLAACKGNDTPPDKENPKKEGIVLSVGSEMAMGVGETRQINAINTKNDSQMTNVLWTSDNEAVATVDFSGIVTGVSDGEANITATSVDGKFNASCKVTVSSVLTGIAFETPSIELEKGSQATLNVVLTPANITDVALTWMTGDLNVVEVDNGVVTAVGNGATSIMVSADGGKFTTACTVTVVTNVTEVTMDEQMAFMNKGDIKQLTVTVAPADSNDPELLWESSNPSVATVDASGNVTAIAGGTTVITATSYNGISDSCNVVVTSPVTGVTLDKEEVVINLGETYRLVATVSPSDATNSDVAWESSDLSVVNVRIDGTLIALKTGTVNITATTVDGFKTAVCKVTVVNAVTELKFAESGSDLEVGKTLQLVPTYAPKDADVPTLTWTSSDPTVATVAEDGTVTAVKIGSATITATTENGVSAEYKLNVVALEVPIEKIVVDTFLNLKIAKPVKFTVSLLPTNTTETYTIKVDKPSIVRLNNDGTLTPLKDGVATITVTSKSGKVTAECIVNVEALTDTERAQYEQEYNDKKAKLDQEHEKNEGDITAKFDAEIASIDATIQKLSITSKADYDTKYADLKGRLDEAQKALDEMTAQGNQELINAYTATRDALQAQLNTLDADLKTFNLLDKSRSDQETNKNNELKSEEDRYKKALEALKEEYAFLF